MRYLALILGLLPALANAQEITKPRLTILNNGLRIITVEDHKSPLVSAVWSVRAGAITEPSGYAGISHLVEHLVTGRGTAKYPSRSVAAVVSGQGGHADARTSYDSTTFEIVLQSKDLDQVLSMHEQMMLRAVFDDKGSDTEKMAVFEELRADRDRPDLYVWDTAPQQMYPVETFYSRSAGGSIENIDAITAERARQYYRDYYVSNNITLAVVGDFDTRTLLAKIASRFAGYKRRNIPPHFFREIAIRPGVTVVAEERDVNRSYFLLAFEGPEMSSPDYLPLEVLMRYIGGDSPTAPLYERLVHKRSVLLRDLGFPLKAALRQGMGTIHRPGRTRKNSGRD
jgi:zinc protease